MTRTSDARDALLAQIAPGSRIVEIGVHEGAFSSRLLSRRPSRLHLVDPWQVSMRPEHATSWYGPCIGKAEMEARHARVTALFRECPEVTIHRCTGPEATDRISGQVDFVYVDGDHRRAAVAADIAAWWPRLAPDGLMGFDDYHPGGWWGDGVIRSVAEALRREDAIVAWKAGDQILLRRQGGTVP